MIIPSQTVHKNIRPEEEKRVKDLRAMQLQIHVNETRVSLILTEDQKKAANEIQRVKHELLTFTARKERNHKTRSQCCIKLCTFFGTKTKYLKLMSRQFLLDSNNIKLKLNALKQ